jgi:hypothetical protein
MTSSRQERHCPGSGTERSAPPDQRPATHQSVQPLTTSTVNVPSRRSCSPRGRRVTSGKRRVKRGGLDLLPLAACRPRLDYTHRTALLSSSKFAHSRGATACSFLRRGRIPQPGTIRPMGPIRPMRACWLRERTVGFVVNAFGGVTRCRDSPRGAELGAAVAARVDGPARSQRP